MFAVTQTYLSPYGSSGIGGMKGGDGMVQKDIFTDMQAKIGCPYLSDLPYYKRAVWFEMKCLCLSDYPKKQLEDFSRYVFGVPYTVIQEALQRKDVMKHGRNACAD